MCDGKTFSTKDIKNPTSRLVTQLTCQLEPTQGAHYCPQRFLQSILGGMEAGWGGSTLAILRLTALYNFEPEEEYSKEPKERERWHQKIPPHHPDRISRLKSWEALAGGASSSPPSSLPWKIWEVFQLNLKPARPLWYNTDVIFFDGKVQAKAIPSEQGAQRGQGKAFPYRLIQFKIF